MTHDDDKGIWYQCIKHGWLEKHPCPGCDGTAHYRCLNCDHGWWEHPVYMRGCPSCGHAYYEWLNKDEWGIN